MAALVSKHLPKNFYRRITWTRFVFLLFQVLSNALIPDHQAGVYQTPLKPSTDELGLTDTLVEYFLNGFTRWDGQYFLHISLAGYTHENCLAFFPLLPVLVNFSARLVKLALLNNISDWHATVLSCYVINSIAFLIASKYLYLLTLRVVNDCEFARKTWEFFCVSPATVFFMSCYSEAVFSALTFSGIFCCTEKRYWAASFLFCLSGATRSNGTLNLGFLVFFVCSQLSLQAKIKDNLLTISSLFPMLLIASSCIFSYQLYAFVTFCYHSDLLQTFPGKVQEYLNKERLVYPGSIIPPWCNNKIPLSYSAVQQNYWDVGFLRYFELKQIPNFVLAFPVMFLVLCYTWIFLTKCPELLSLLYPNHPPKKNVHPIFMGKNCVFVTHAAFLAIFTFFCAHVQISTRLIGSSSPVIYWFMTWLTENDGTRRNRLPQNTPILWPFTRENTTAGKLVSYYCTAYVFIGLFMFSNWLPWT